MINSIVTVRAIITIAPHFMDLKKDIIRRSAHNDAVKALINILNEIDWISIDFSKTDLSEINRVEVERLHDKMISVSSVKKGNGKPSTREKGKEKDKEKESENAGENKDTNVVTQIQNELLKKAIQQVVFEINEYNKNNKEHDQIDEYTWAQVCTEIIAKNDLLNISSQQEKIAYRIFVKQLCDVFEEHFILVQEASSSDYLVDVMPEIFLRYLGSLEQNHKLNEVAAIHNYIHLGYLISIQSEFCEVKDISMLLAASLLTGFDVKNKIDIPAIIYHGFVKLFEPIFIHEHFSMPYTLNKYHDYRQDPRLFIPELKDLLSSFVDDNMIKSLYDRIPLPVTAMKERSETEEILPKSQNARSLSSADADSSQQPEGVVKKTIRKRVGMFLRNICGAQQEIEGEKPVKPKYHHGNRTSTYGSRNSHSNKTPISKTARVKKNDQRSVVKKDELSSRSGESWPNTPSELVEPTSGEHFYTKSTSDTVIVGKQPLDSISQSKHNSNQDGTLETLDNIYHSLEVGAKAGSLSVEGLTPLFFSLALSNEDKDTPPPSSNREQRIGSNSYPGHLRKVEDPQPGALLLGQQGSGSARILGAKVLNSPFIQNDLVTPNLNTKQIEFGK